MKSDSFGYVFSDFNKFISVHRSFNYRKIPYGVWSFSVHTIRREKSCSFMSYIYVEGYWFHKEWWRRVTIWSRDNVKIYDKIVDRK